MRKFIVVTVLISMAGYLYVHTEGLINREGKLNFDSSETNKQFKHEYVGKGIDQAELSKKFKKNPNHAAKYVRKKLKVNEDLFKKDFGYLSHNKQVEKITKLYQKTFEDPGILKQRTKASFQLLQKGLRKLSDFNRCHLFHDLTRSIHSIKKHGFEIFKTDKVNKIEEFLLDNYEITGKICEENRNIHNSYNHLAGAIEYEPFKSRIKKELLYKISNDSIPSLKDSLDHYRSEWEKLQKKQEDELNNDELVFYEDLKERILPFYENNIKKLERFVKKYE